MKGQDPAKENRNQEPKKTLDLKIHLARQPDRLGVWRGQIYCRDYEIDSDAYPVYMICHSISGFTQDEMMNDIMLKVQEYYNSDV